MDRNPWDRLDDESAPAYRAFLAYRDLGPARTVADAGRTLGGRERGAERAPDGRRKGASGCVRTWSKRYRWAERAEAYDRHQDEHRERAKLAVVEDEAAKLQRLRERHKVETLAIASQVKVKALEMLKAPLWETVTEKVEQSPDGKTVHIHQTVSPAGWRLRDVTRFLATATAAERTILFPEDRAPRLAQQFNITPAAPPPVQATLPDQGQLDEAEEELRAWRARQQAAMLAFPSTPPGMPTAPVNAG